MKYYRKPSGYYIPLEDSVPVSETLIPVAERPSKNHPFAANWQSVPMNPEVCWRLKTTTEIDAEKTQTAINDPVLRMIGASILDPRSRVRHENQSRQLPDSGKPETEGD